MRTIELNPVFSIGDILFYNIPEGNYGMLTDITYRASSNILWYHVTFDPQLGEVACREFELSKEKKII